MRPVLRYLVLAALWPATAIADINTTCGELWFARNAMLDDAGYCFSTPLGRSLFDNTDCTTRAPIVDAKTSQQISIIQDLERNPPFAQSQGQQCRIDTSQQSLDQLAYIDLRKRVAFQPATDGSTGGCIGYQGDAFLLYAAPDKDADVLGVVDEGFSFTLSHLPWDDWNFAIVWRDTIGDDPVTLGWYRKDIGQNCGLFAG